MQTLVAGAHPPVTAPEVACTLHFPSGGPELDLSAVLVSPDGKVRSDADFVFRAGVIR